MATDLAGSPTDPMAPPRSWDAVRRVGVVVPARDEERHLEACLTALRAAATLVTERRPEVEVEIVVAADRCVDGTADVARRAAVTTLVSHHGRVGAARAMGAELLVRGAPELRRLWLANTDADSAVPADWLLRQVEAAEGGADLVLGPVLPVGLPSWALAAWTDRHRLIDGHDHVFGAHLGVRGSHYARVGGFASVATGEDVALVDAVLRSGGRLRTIGGPPVLTSGRRVGRAPHGMAEYLRLLVEQGPDETVA